MDAVVFDLDDTLIIDDSAMTAGLVAAIAAVQGRSWQSLFQQVWQAAHSDWESSIVGELGSRSGIAPMEMMLTDFRRVHPRYSALAEVGPAHQFAVWGAAVASVVPQAADQVPALVRRFKSEARARYTLHAGALAILSHLTGRWKLGLLSNGPGDLQNEKLETLGLLDYFDAVVISGEAGESKPGAAAFELVLSRLDCPPARAVMVGNHPADDVAAAQAAGMHAILLRDSRDAGSTDPACPTICTLAELPSALGAFE